MDRVPGSTGNAESDAYYGRVNCYRRVAGMSPGRINKWVQAETESHVAWLESTYGDTYNGEYLDLFFEFNGNEVTSVWDRLEDAGYVLEPEITFLWTHAELLGDRDVVDFVEEWVDDPYYRQLYLQPGWRGAGLATSEHWVYLLVMSDFPSAVHSHNPVVYPADGQEDARSTWWSYPYDRVDGVPVDTLLGYPITVTVGGDEGNALDDDPYNLRIDWARLTGPDGELEFYPIRPTETTWNLRDSVVMVPDAPLVPGETYTAEFELTWSNGWRKPVASTFTVSPDAVDDEPTEVTLRRRSGPLRLERPR